MTAAQRKAHELYGYFYDRIEHTLSEEYSVNEKKIVKTLALKVCDEVLANVNVQTNHTFWIEVRNELDKL